mmetsp:Transcript_19103/g.47935  ORF Transcript_19103/g.47935 Transcript_19103/m.47935 type:complete len:108 (-) Transcript_19103:1151-1474(-)
MVAYLPFGYLSDDLSVKSVLIAASAIQILGNLAYTAATSPGALFAARFVVGFGSATTSVCRAPVARAVPRRDRTGQFAYLGALQFVGFAVLPGVVWRGFGRWGAWGC